MSSMCSCLLQGGISCNIVLSTGLVSLYSFSKYSLYLFLILVLLSSSLPSLSFIAAVLVLALPQISFTIWYNFLVSCFFALSSASWDFPSSHCSLHCFAVFLISRVSLLYLFLISSLCVFFVFIALLWSLILSTSCKIHGFCFLPFLVPSTCCATSVYMDLMSSQVSSTLSLFFSFVCFHLLFSRVLYSPLTKLSSSHSVSNLFPNFSLCIVFSLTLIPAITRL